MAGPLTRQAENEARLRFGPQRFALRELLAQAVEQRDMHMHAAAGAERGIQSAIEAARREAPRTYDAAAETTTGTRSLVDEALAKLGQGAAPFAAAIARERGGASDRLAEGKANTLQELTQRKLEAASGRAYATTAATQEFGANVSKVQRSYQELAGEEGAFTQGRVGELKKEQADRAFQRDLAEFTQGQQNKRARTQARTQRRGQDISHADRQAAARAKAKDKTTANRPRTGVGSLTQGEENKIKDSVTQVLSVITNPPDFEDPPKGAKPGEKGPRLTHGRMLQHLRNGTNPLKKPIPDDLIKIAYELRDNNGVLGPKGVKLLHSRGMHVPKEWLPKPRTEQYGPSGAILPGR